MAQLQEPIEHLLVGLRAGALVALASVHSQTAATSQSGLTPTVPSLLAALAALGGATKSGLDYLKARSKPIPATPGGLKLLVMEGTTPPVITTTKAWNKKASSQLAYGGVFVVFAIIMF